MTHKYNPKILYFFYVKLNENNHFRCCKTDVSDICSSGNIREIMNKFSNNCEKMYMYMLFWKILKEIRQFDPYILEHCMA